MDGDAQKDIMRSFMKEGVNTREKENFRRFVQALLNVVGKEEYHSILQVCYERATEMSDRNTEVKTLGHFVSDFETKKNSYKDLGKGPQCACISRGNPVQRWSPDAVQERSVSLGRGSGRTHRAAHSPVTPLQLFFITRFVKRPRVVL